MRRGTPSRARDFVTLTMNNVGTETESTTLRTVVQQAHLAAANYVSRDIRDATLEALGDSLQQLAIDAEPGSDAQFQFVKAFAAVARTPEQLSVVSHLLDGTVPLPGLDVDTDLKWELLIAQVAAGLAGETEIAATLAADDTATGRQSAAHARAAIPTPEGKAAAWASLVDADTASNLTVRATLLGFARANDPSLLTPYIERYFSTVEQLWATRSHAIAEALAKGLYPSGLASEQLAAASRSWLDAHPDRTALRRVVVENLAAVERALAAQARDADD